jgi:hypothetical protein
MTKHICPRCDKLTAEPWCCGIDLRARKRWRMTRELVRMIHVLARSRKGLTEEEYRLRLAAVGVSTSLQLGRDQFYRLLDGLRALPDSPLWTARVRRTRAADRLVRAG